jgi:hypothetical protein
MSRSVLLLAILATASPAWPQEAATCTGAADESAVEGAVSRGAPPNEEPTGFRWRDALLGLAVIGVGVGGIAYVRRNERRRRGRPDKRAEPIDRVPYLTGGALGLLAAISLVAFGRPIGISGGVQNLAGAVGHAITPGTGYWGGVIPIGWTWSAWVVVGVFLGAFVSATLAGTWRLRVVPGRAWVARYGPRPWRRWVLAFAAAALIEIAAAIAGGCTSGLAVSGGVVLAPGAFLFMIAMFASGVPTAWWIDRGRKP